MRQLQALQEDGVLMRADERTDTATEEWERNRYKQQNAKTHSSHAALSGCGSSTDAEAKKHLNFIGITHKELQELFWILDPSII